MTDNTDGNDGTAAVIGATTMSAAATASNDHPNGADQRRPRTPANGSLVVIPPA